MSWHLEDHYFKTWAVSPLTHFTETAPSNVVSCATNLNDVLCLAFCDTYVVNMAGQNSQLLLERHMSESHYLE